VGEAEGKSFIAMEYVEGETLKVKMAAGRVPLKEALKISSDIASALEKAHKAGIVHRDLKPDNIRLTPESHVKVMDFGLAKSIQREEEEITAVLTREGTTLGTLTYMSPEQLKGAPVDSRSDIFSFGVLLYEMLTGVHPFRTGTQAETINSILNEHPSPISRYTGDTSDILQHRVEKMLAKDPDKRYQLIHDVRTNLTKMWERLSVSGLLVSPSELRRERRWGFRSLLLGTAAIAGIGIAFVWWQLFTSAPEMEPLRIVPFTVELERESFPSFSPDGDQIAYVKYMTPRKSGIHVRLVGGRVSHQLTEGEARDLSPVWSPDGREIAFIRETEGEVGIFTA
jgi:serine/threonine protein kinase